MRILVAEDETPKLVHVQEFLGTAFPEVEVVCSRSVRGSIAVLAEIDVDVIILDMSLPTFDIAAGERGGRPQGFGGIEVMRELERLDVLPSVIVLTQYEAFLSNGKNYGLDDVRAQLAAEHPDTFFGLVYFNSLVGGWKEELEELLSSCFRNRKGEA